MVTPSPASIVVVDFPFSNLSASKLRPAVVLCDAGRGDWLLCQVTSNPHSDAKAVRITPAQLVAGSLSLLSFARPLKLFTANEALMDKRVAVLKDDAFKEILLAIVYALRTVLPT